MATNEHDPRRAEIAEAFTRCLRSGEAAAVAALRPHLAPEVRYVSNGAEIRGVDAVLQRLTGQWPLTPALARGAWDYPVVDGALVRITANFDTQGAAPRDYAIAFEFDDVQRVRTATETFTFPPKLQKSSTIPAHVRAAIDRALANGTPMVLSYVDDQGAPSLSLRGSIQVWSPTELCAWIRDAGSGLVRAVQAGRPLGLLYRDSATRTTLVIRGRGRIAADETTRQAVFQRVPEVEQTHDLARRGAALLIQVERIAGTHPSGNLLVEP